MALDGVNIGKDSGGDTVVLGKERKRAYCLRLIAYFLAVSKGVLAR